MDAHNLWKTNVVKSNKNKSNDEWLLRAKIHAQKQAHQKKLEELAHQKKLEEEQKKSQQIAIAALKAWKEKNSIVINL
jgi:hypothetical protein